MRVTFHGAPDAPIAAAPTPMTTATASGEPGATKEEVVPGDRVFHGEVAGGTCTGCHGLDSNGSPQGPSLVNGHWLVGDGSLQSITHIIADGIPKPWNYSVPMPPKGAAPLSNRRRRLCLGHRPSGREVGRHSDLHRQHSNQRQTPAGLALADVRI
jgi:hypothetical protein